MRIDLCDLCRLTVTSAPDILGRVLIVCSLRTRRKTAAGDLGNIEWLAFEAVYIRFTLNHERKRRGHHAPDIQA